LYKKTVSTRDYVSLPWQLKKKLKKEIVERREEDRRGHIVCLRSKKYFACIRIERRKKPYNNYNLMLRKIDKSFPKSWTFNLYQKNYTNYYLMLRKIDKSFPKSMTFNFASMKLFLD
jgi:hypothetical protein